MDGREEEDLSRLTPPWHFVPNARDLQGWHFRDSSNWGPNTGSVDSPGELREFIFSPEVGRGIEYAGSETTEEDVERVRSFGRGWLRVDDFSLAPPDSADPAAFRSLRFIGCLTTPATG